MPTTKLLASGLFNCMTMKQRFNFESTFQKCQGFFFLSTIHVTLHFGTRHECLLGIYITEILFISPYTPSIIYFIDLQTMEKSHTQKNHLIYLILRQKTIFFAVVYNIITIIHTQDILRMYLPIPRVRMLNCTPHIFIAICTRFGIFRNKEKKNVKRIG